MIRIDWMGLDRSSVPDGGYSDDEIIDMLTQALQAAAKRDKDAAEALEALRKIEDARVTAYLEARESHISDSCSDENCEYCNDRYNDEDYE